jgi:hypothetical protein
MTALINPAHHAAAVTPHDSTDIAETRGLYVGVSGDVKVDMASGGSAVTFSALAAGYVHPLRVTRVYSTGTTATNIVALY